MKQWAWEPSVFAVMRRIKAVKTKTSPWKETGLDAIGQIPASAEGKGNISLDIPFYRTTYKTRVAT
ncbi:MAG: hypothetical protein JOZ36_17440 [Acidobacteria bacterium]|nr:hypothetical protein [Acidobacteriota bacterium]